MTGGRSSAVAPRGDPRAASPRRAPRPQEGGPSRGGHLVSCDPGYVMGRPLCCSRERPRSSRAPIAASAAPPRSPSRAREPAVAVHYHADERGAEQTANVIRTHGYRAEVFRADVAEPTRRADAAERLCAAVLERRGRLDSLVTNAGTGENTERSLDLPPAAFRRGLKVDLVAPWILAREAANHMVAQGGGGIVNGTSVHEEIPQPGGAAYCAAQGGLRMVTRTLALELARQHVRINSARPHADQPRRTRHNRHADDGGDASHPPALRGGVGKTPDGPTGRGAGECRPHHRPRLGHGALRHRQHRLGGWRPEAQGRTGLTRRTKPSSFPTKPPGTGARPPHPRDSRWGSVLNTERRHLVLQGDATEREIGHDRFPYLLAA